jgi:hypothetical protein
MVPEITGHGPENPLHKMRPRGRLRGFNSKNDAGYEKIPAGLKPNCVNTDN